MTTGILRRGAPLLIPGLVLGALAFRLFRLVSQYAVNLFFWDQWDFNDATVFQYHSLWEIFRWQHGPHRQGLGGLLTALLEPWFSWNSRTEAFLATGLVVIAALCALYLKYRLFGKLSWTDAIIPIVILSTAQWESLWSTVNLSHGILPLLLVILYCILWTWKSEHLKFALITLLNFGITYTGFGFFVGILTPVLLIASYRNDRTRTTGAKIYLASCLLVTLGSLGSFFVGYHNDPASGCASLTAPSPIQYFWFIDLMFTHPFGIRGIGLMARSGGILVLAAVALVAAVSWKRLFGGTALALVPAVLSTYSLLFCVSAAAGRTCIGLTAAHTSRYAIFTQLGILSLYFCALAAKPSRQFVLSSVLLVALLPSLRINAFDARGMQMFSNSKAGWRACYLGGHSIAECDQAFGPIHPEPEKTRLKEKLDFLEETQQNLFSDSR